MSAPIPPPRNLPNFPSPRPVHSERNLNGSTGSEASSTGHSPPSSRHLRKSPPSTMNVSSMQALSMKDAHHQTAVPPPRSPRMTANQTVPAKSASRSDGGGSVSSISIASEPYSNPRRAPGPPLISPKPNFAAYQGAASMKAPVPLPRLPPQSGASSGHLSSKPSLALSSQPQSYNVQPLPSQPVSPMIMSPTIQSPASEQLLMSIPTTSLAEAQVIGIFLYLLTHL